MKTKIHEWMTTYKALERFVEIRQRTKKDVNISQMSLEDRELLTQMTTEFSKNAIKNAMLEIALGNSDNNIFISNKALEGEQE